VAAESAAIIMKFIFSQILLILRVTNTGKFWLNMNFWLSFTEVEEKQYVSIRYLNPNSYKVADDIS